MSIGKTQKNTSEHGGEESSTDDVENNQGRQEGELATEKHEQTFAHKKQLSQDLLIISEQEGEERVTLLISKEYQTKNCSIF